MNIKITRNKKFVGALIPYIIIINYDLEDFKKYIIQEGYALSKDAMKNLSYLPFPFPIYKNIPKKFDVEKFKAYLNISNLGETVKIIEIGNGETKTLEMDNTKVSIFVASFTSSGVFFGNQVYYDGISMNKSYLVETKYNWITGSEVFIRDVDNEITYNENKGNVGKVLGIIGVVLTILYLLYSSILTSINNKSNEANNLIINNKINKNSNISTNNKVNENNNSTTNNKIKGEFSREIFSNRNYDYKTQYDNATFKFNSDGTFECAYEKGNTYKGTYEVYNGLFISTKVKEIEMDSSIKNAKLLADDINKVSTKMISNANDIKSMLNVYLLYLKADQSIENNITDEINIIQPFVIKFDTSTNSGIAVNILARAQGSFELK